MKHHTLARVLGWTSLAIAAAEIFGQGYVERELLGIDEHPHLMRGLGIREAVAGITILSQRRTTGTLAAGLWSRVAGDAMDLSLLGLAAPQTRKAASFMANLATVVGITALDIYAAVKTHSALRQTRSAQPKQRSKEPIPSQGSSRVPERIAGL